MSDVHGMHRKSDPHTSVEAAESVVGKLRELQIKVLQELETAGVNGLTDYELEERCGSHGSTYRTRRSELVEKGLVLDSGRRRVIADGNRIVWIAAQFREANDALQA